MKYSILLSLFLILSILSTSHARPIPDWGYQVLYEKADVVVIAKPSASKPNENPDEVQRGPLQQMETVFEIRSALKGNAPPNKPLKFVHFRKMKNVASDNGPLLVHFLTGKNGPDYLLFLKRREDGRYEAVTGQTDPIYSVKVLSSPDEVAGLSKHPPLTAPSARQPHRRGRLNRPSGTRNLTSQFPNSKAIPVWEKTPVGGHTAASQLDLSISDSHATPVRESTTAPWATQATCTEFFKLSTKKRLDVTTACRYI